MEDNKEKLNNPGEADQTQTNGQTQPASGPDPIDFGATGMDDINKNVGHFTNTVNQPEVNNGPELKLDVDAKVVEKAANEEINFDRFSKTKKERKHVDKAPKTRFGEKVAMMLRSKKGLTVTWVLEIVIMLLIIGACIGLIVWMTPYLKTRVIQTFCHGITKTGIVFLWIAMFPCVIPLIYLLTTWFIGINQVASSKFYHYFFWITGIVSIVCFVVGIGLCAEAMHYITINPGIQLFNAIL